MGIKGFVVSIVTNVFINYIFFLVLWEVSMWFHLINILHVCYWL
jgi:hypothetical protein